jgi:penicillin G amidase
MDIYLLTAIAIGLVGAVVLAFLALLWAIFRRPLPQVKGELHIDGLDAAVEVVRDHWGVPHIYADSEHDAWFAQGYVHAQDRLFQMEYTRRLARGAMAEAFGAAALEADRWSRVLGFWRATLGDLEQLSADDRAVLEAYAAGVNACVEARRYRLPAEFTIMGLKPEPWQPEDTLGVLKVLAWALSQNWEGEICVCNCCMRWVRSARSSWTPSIRPAARSSRRPRARSARRRWPMPRAGCWPPIARPANGSARPPRPAATTG